MESNDFRSCENDALQAPAPLVRGMARCIWSEGMEEVLEEGALYYIREMPNMQGHVLALRSGELPLVGIHLERFEQL